MKNMQAMMQQAQQLQAKMQAAQEHLNDLEVSGQSGGGLVTALVSGKGALKALNIDPALIDPEDPDLLADLVVAAVNNAYEKAEEEAARATQAITGGLNLPDGLGL